MDRASTRGAVAAALTCARNDNPERKRGRRQRQPLPDHVGFGCASAPDLHVRYPRRLQRASDAPSPTAREKCGGSLRLCSLLNEFQRGLAVWSLLNVKPFGFERAAEEPTDVAPRQIGPWGAVRAPSIRHLPGARLPCTISALGGPCDPGCKVSVHELAECVERGQHRRYHLVHFRGILQVRPQDPLPGLVE